MKQQTLAMAADAQSGYEQYRKPTRRDEFLKTMEAVMPWAALCAVIEPYYPKAGNGRPPSQSGLAHSAVVTAANVHDKHPLPDLLHGNERRVYGDSAYASQKELIGAKAPKARDFTNQRSRHAGQFSVALTGPSHWQTPGQPCRTSSYNAKRQTPT